MVSNSLGSANRRPRSSYLDLTVQVQSEYTRVINVTVHNRRPFTTTTGHSR